MSPFRRNINGHVVHTGNIRTPGAIAPQPLCLANAARLAKLHEIRFGAGPGMPTIVNSAGHSGLWGWMGNNAYDNCVGAAEGHYKQIISLATGAAEVDIPDGAVVTSGYNPNPGCVPWCQNWNVLNGAWCGAVPQYMSQPDAMGHVGMQDAAGRWHGDGANPTGASYPYLYALDWTNQSEVILALTYFKAFTIGFNASVLQSYGASGGYSGANYWWAFGRTLATLNPGIAGDHAAVVCDCGTAAALATAYGVSVPDGLSPLTFCIALITWNTLGILDWLSFQSATDEAWLRITDPDRGDAATFNPIAETDYLAMITSPTAAACYVEYQLCC